MIGEHIRRLRTMNGYTLKALGAMLGLSESTMSLYESNKREPDIATLLKMAEIFGTTIDSIVSGDTEVSAAETEDLSDVSLDGVQFAFGDEGIDTSGLTEEHLNIVRRLVKAMREEQQEKGR